MEIIKYSIFDYSPSIISHDTLTVGILFDNVTTSQREFHAIKKLNRLSAIDDAVDVTEAKKYLESINNDVKSTFFNNQFNIEDYIRFFVNEYHFGPVKEVEVADGEEFVAFTKKAYMPQEYEKKDRLNPTQQLSYLKTYGKNHYQDYSASKISGSFNEPLNVDFTVNNLAIKFFDLNGKNLAYVYNAAKAWAYNASKLSGDKKFVFIYSLTENENCDDAKNIITILRENELTFDFSEGIKFLGKHTLV